MTRADASAWQSKLQMRDKHTDGKQQLSQAIVMRRWSHTYYSSWSLAGPIKHNQQNVEIWNLAWIQVNQVNQDNCCISCQQTDVSLDTTGHNGAWCGQEHTWTSTYWMVPGMGVGGGKRGQSLQFRAFLFFSQVGTSDYKVTMSIIRDLLLFRAEVISCPTTV